jgi:hypothetical protein
MEDIDDSFEKQIDEPRTRKSEQTLTITTADGKKYQAVYERTLSNVDEKGMKYKADILTGSSYRFSSTKPKITAVP